MVDGELLAGLEGLLFVSDEPVELAALAMALATDHDHVLVLLDELSRRLAGRESGLVVRQVAGGWRLYTDPAIDEVIERHLLVGRSGRLSQAALETLAVVAYKQPMARGDISDIRGVNADGAVRSLVARGLLEEVGRDEGPGQAVLYGTTTRFLEELGLVSLDALPDLASVVDDLDAPDEPVGPDLRAARRALQAGHRLPATGSPTWDGETVDDTPVELFQQRRQRQMAFSELTDDLEDVARAAMARLEEAMTATANRDRADLDDHARRDDAPAVSTDEPATATAEGHDG